jgi:hypothetical protein
LQIGVEEVWSVDWPRHGRVGAVGQFFGQFPSSTKLGLVCQDLLVLLRETWWLQTDAHGDGASRCCAAEVVRSWSQRAGQSRRAAGIVGSCEEEVVQRVFAGALAARRIAGVGMTEVDKDVEVPAALGAVRGDLVEGGGRGVVARDGQLALLVFAHEGVSAVAVRDGGDGGGVWAVFGGRGGEQVAAGTLFVAGVVGEEVLEQARGRLACRRDRPWLAERLDQARGDRTGRHGCDGRGQWSGQRGQMVERREMGEGSSSAGNAGNAGRQGRAWTSGNQVQTGERERGVRRGGVSVPQEQEPAPEQEQEQQQEHTGRAQEHALGNQPASQTNCTSRTAALSMHVHSLD